MSLRQISTILIAVCVLSLATVVPTHAQFSFPTLTVQVLKDPAPGYYFLAPSTLDSIAFLDNSGRYVYRFKVGSHTNILTYQTKWLTHFIAENGINGYVRRGTDLRPIDTMRVTTPYVTDFHEARVVSDTSYIILGTNVVTMDLSNVVPGGDSNATVWANVIQERTFDGRTLFTWNSLDHIPVTDCADTADITGNFVDYLHVNSVIKDTDGNYIVSGRHIDEVFKIDRRTGAIMWRMGGSRSRNNQFRFLNDTTDGFFGFSHQHSVSRTADGTLLVFDNGNLKPEPQVSRVVEYEIDEVNKTARRVWQYIPKPNVYVRTMGSAEELENGNILIGYGSASNTMLAQEVDRDGVVQFQVTNLGLNGLSSYRVHKAPFRMTGTFKRITSTGALPMTRADSTTHITLNVTRLDAATSVVAERHYYAPHDVSVESGTACGIIANRWVVRVKNIGGVTGTMTFAVGNVPGVEYPEQVKLYHRSVEGKGAFTLLEQTYDASTRSIKVDRIRNGEYFIAYPSCLAPNLLEPVIGATEVSTSPTLRWSEAIGVGSYQVEISSDPSFTTISQRFTTSRLDTNLAGFPEYATLYWRIRSKTLSGFGPWSTVGRFTTVLGIPTIRTPKVSGKDTVAVLPGHVFEWSSAVGAIQYRMTILPMDGNSPVVDTVLVGRSFVPSGLAANTWYTWTVRSANDTVTGRLSEAAVFITAPVAPSLIEPASDANDVATSSAVFRWNSVDGARTYRVTVRRAKDSSIVFRDSTTETSFTADELPGAERLVWTCRAQGRYGPGPEAPQRSFTTLSTTRLAAPIVVAPQGRGDVDSLGVQFRWNRVDGAVAYDLQLTTRTTFEDPDIEVTGLVDTNWVAPSLRSGMPYAWRVIASAPQVVGQWSDTACFSTTPLPLQGLSPVLPLNGARNATTAGIFVYTTSTSYISYEVFVDDDPAFGSPDFRSESPIGTCSYSELRPGRWYFWRVSGILPDETRFEGPAARFFIPGTTSVERSVDPPVHVTATRNGDRLSVGLVDPMGGNCTVRVFTVQGRLIQIADLSEAVGTVDCVLPSSTAPVLIRVEPTRSGVTPVTLMR